jgi:hypothetical protein
VAECALLFKQTRVYLLVFCVLTLLVTGQGRRIISRDAVLFAAIIAVLAGPFLTLMLFFLQGKAVANDLGSHRMSGWERITYFGQTLPSSFCSYSSVLALRGSGARIPFGHAAADNDHGMLDALGLPDIQLGWAKGTSVCGLLVSPLVYFAVGLITSMFRVGPMRVATRAAAALLIVILVIPAWRYQRPYIGGCKEAAARIVKGYDSGIILFYGPVPGNSVFFVRAWIRAGGL